MSGSSETRDAAGRVTIVVKDTQIWWLAVYALVIFMVFIGFETVTNVEYPKKWFWGIGAAIALVGAAYYLFTRQTLRVQLDPKGRTLSVGAGGGRERVLPYAEVQSASIAEEDRSSSDGSGAWTTVRRLDLVLRSGERVMVPEKFGTFREAPCNKLLARIHGALRQG
jgi:hypothetical protein